MGSGVSGETSEPEYNIFYDLRTYNDHEKKVDNGGYPNEIVSLCEKIQNGEQGWNEEIKKICEKLMKYFLYWSKHKTDNNNNKSICNYIEYLNYWLNGELRRNIISESDRHRTYEHFNKVIAEESNLCDLKDKFYNIKDEYYENMKIMHELYENFYKIKSIGDNGTDEKNECSNYVNNCVNKFRQFKDKCYVQENKDEEGYKKLCNALREFNGIYKINRYYQKSCKNVKLLDLPVFKKPKVATVEKKLEKFTKCSTTTHIYAVDNNEEKYEKDILEELDDYKFYNDFNNKDYSSEFNEYCSEIKPPIDNRCKIYTLCAKIETNLKGLSKIENIKNANDRCLYFTYWVYNQISKTFSNNSNYIVDIPDINEIFKVIYAINNTFEEKDKCYVDYRHKAKVGELKEMKHMHDYFMVFENLKTHLPCKKENRKKCCDYAKHINGLYKKYIGNCCTCYFHSNECHNNCDYFKCDQSYNPYKLYKEFECDQLEDKVKGFEKVGKPTAIDYYVIRLSSLKPQCNTIFCDLFYVFVLAAFSVLGLFFVFFILYKVGEISH